MKPWLAGSTWFPVVDVEVEDPGDEVGEEGRHPVHQEHGRHAEQRPEQGQQWVVVLQQGNQVMFGGLLNQVGSGAFQYRF